MPSYCRKSPFPEQPIKVLSPQCPCDKCKGIRETLKPTELPFRRSSLDLGAINDIKKRLAEICSPCGRRTSETARPCGKRSSAEVALITDPCAPSDRKADSAGDGNGNGNGNGAVKFFDFVYETIGIIAFFVIATTMFWLAVAHTLCKLIVKIYRSNRRTQLLAISLLCLLILSISYTLISKSLKAKWRARKLAAEKACEERKTAEKTAAEQMVAQKSAADKSCAKAYKRSTSTVHCPHSDAPLQTAKASRNAKFKEKPEPCTVTQNVTITITDSEAKEIFKKSKLYAIPTEMKQPPALLVYLRDVVLTGY